MADKSPINIWFMYVDTFVTFCRKIIITNQNTRFWIPMNSFPVLSVFAVYLNTLSVTNAYFCLVTRTRRTGSLRLHSDWLRAGRSGDRIPVRERFSAPVQTGPGAHPAFCTMTTRSFPGVKGGRGVTLTPHPPLVPWSWKSRAIPLLPLSAQWLSTFFLRFRNKWPKIITNLPYTCTTSVTNNLWSSVESNKLTFKVEVWQSSK
jgi:hypothetical protein